MLINICLLVFTLLAWDGYAQDSPVGKRFVAQTGASCKEMTDGGCMIYTYCVLAFETDSVAVYYNVEASCTPQSREANYRRNGANNKTYYTWSLQDKTKLHIQGWPEEADLFWQNETLTGNRVFKIIQ